MSIFNLAAIFVVVTFSGCVNRNGVLGPVKEWKIQDCIEVHQLLKTVFSDQGAAESKSQYCQISLFSFDRFGIFVIVCHFLHLTLPH